MRRILREALYWALSLIFAGVMLAGFFAEISVGTWFGGLLKVVLAFIGFAGCYWASNQTALGRRIADGDY